MKKCIKFLCKRIMRYINIVILLLTTSVTVLLGIKYYNFFANRFVVMPTMLCGVVLPFIDKLLEIMGLKTPPILIRLSINAKKKILSFSGGVIIACMILSFYPINESEEKENLVEESNSEETYEINVLNDVDYNVDVGDVISVDLNIITPESYIFETTPFVLYTGYYDEEQRSWIQISAFRLSAGEENYSLHINTKLLGLSEGRYMISFDLFKSSDYAEGRSLTNKNILLNLNGNSIHYESDPFDRGIIKYEKISDVFVINGIAYRYDVEELNLGDIQNEDLIKISRCKNIKKLQISGEDLTDLDPLSHLYSLESLYILSKNLEDITPISELINLKQLSVGGLQYNGMGFSGKLEDISPIENLINLETLSISDCQVEDIGALRKLNKLTMLWIYKTCVKDISSLEDLVLLKDVRLHNNKISDISVLKKLNRLEYLILSGNPIIEEQISRLQLSLSNCDIKY